MIDKGSKTGSDAEYAGVIEAYALDFFDAAAGAPRHSSPVGSPARRGRRTPSCPGQNWVFTALTKLPKLK